MLVTQKPSSKHLD